MRGETRRPAGAVSAHRISIHSPHARGDSGESTTIFFELFQSTPLMRGETLAADLCTTALTISIHSPHARGDMAFRLSRRVQAISIHSPHARGDTPLAGRSGQRITFQSTPLMRGETRVYPSFGVWQSNFNPLPSCEGRLYQPQQGDYIKDFNPLPSCEGRRV